DGEFHPRIQHHFGTGFMMHLGACFRGHRLGGFLMEAASDVLAAVGTDGYSVFAIGGAVVGRFYVAVLVVFDSVVAVVLDDFGAVVLGEQVQVFLGVDVDLFFVRLILKPQFVAAFALVGFGFQGGSCFVLRQRIRRCVGRVVGSAGNNGLVRVAVQEGDDDFVADSRQGHEAVLAASPALADSE